MAGAKTAAWLKTYSPLKALAGVLGPYSIACQHRRRSPSESSVEGSPTVESEDWSTQKTWAER